MATVVCQYWYESEADWGQRPDGCSLHKNEVDRVAFCKEYWKHMPKEVPFEYSREDGIPKLVDVDDKVYQEIVDSKNGVRYEQRRMPKGL